MPQVEITSQLARHADCPTSQTVAGGTLKDVFESLITDHPELREQVFDGDGVNPGAPGRFPIDGEMLADRSRLDVPVAESSEVFVMQALSGG